MTKTPALILAIVCLTAACTSKNQRTSPYPYTFEMRDSIWVEVFDSTITDETRYTQNNSIYEAEDQYLFDYAYIDEEGRRFKMQQNEGAGELEYEEQKRAWYFVPEDSLTEDRIEYIEMLVTPGLSPFDQWMPDYYQTVVLFNYLNASREQVYNGGTGVIENEKNVWSHPPRQFLFMILELNPFPFIQAPYEIGNTWGWSLLIGNSWDDQRWKTWEGNIRNDYQYEITGQETITTEAGSFDCYVVESKARSSLGETYLTSWFNEEAGFVKLEYVNIDGTEFELELIEIQKGDS